MDLGDLKKYWQKANPLYGQRKKAYESVYLAKLTHNRAFCPLLFNVVVHPGNLRVVKDVLSFSKPISLKLRLIHIRPKRRLNTLRWSGRKRMFLFLRSL